MQVFCKFCCGLLARYFCTRIVYENIYRQFKLLQYGERVGIIWLLHYAKSGFVTKPEDWKYSSAGDYAGIKGQVALCTLY